MTPRTLSVALLTFLTACQSEGDPLELTMRGKFDPKTDTEPSYPDPQPLPPAPAPSTCPTLPTMLTWETYVSAPSPLFTTTRPGAVTVVENDPAAPGRLIAYGVGVSPEDGTGEVIFRMSLPAADYAGLSSTIVAELATLDGGPSGPNASKATSYGILKVGGVPVGPGPGGGDQKKLRRVVDVAVGVSQPLVPSSTTVVLSATCN